MFTLLTLSMQDAKMQFFPCDSRFIYEDNFGLLDIIFLIENISVVACQKYLTVCQL